jgi:hypothetical protein
MQSSLIAAFLGMYAAVYAVYVFDMKYPGAPWYTSNTRLSILLGSYYATSIGAIYVMPR